MTKVRRLVLTLAGVIAGASLGVAAGVAVASPGSNSADVEFPTPGPTELNSNGQSFGSLAGYSDEDAPDLISVTLADGTEGYVYSDDLFAAEGQLPASPEDAAALATADESTAIPVYQVDGTTQIGDFIVGGYDDTAPDRP